MTTTPAYVDDRGHIQITNERWGGWQINASRGFHINGPGDFPAWPGSEDRHGPRQVLAELLARATDDDATLAGLVRLLADTGAGTVNETAAARDRVAAYVAAVLVDHITSQDEAR